MLKNISGTVNLSYTALICVHTSSFIEKIARKGQFQAISPLWHGQTCLMRMIDAKIYTLGYIKTCLVWIENG